MRMTKRQPTVRVLDQDFCEWDFNGTIRGTDDGILLVHPDDLVGCKAVDLLNAMRRQEKKDIGYPEAVWVSQGPRDQDLSRFGVTPVQFAFGANSNLILHLMHFVDEWEDDDEILRQRVEAALAPLLERNGLDLVKAGYDPYYSTVVPYHLNIDLGVHLRGQDLQTLYAAGEDACALLAAIFEGNAGRSEIADLLRGGHASALIGQYENDWLEAKREHYDLQTIDGKVSLALAVARFANSPDGGLIVVGLTTKSRAEGDEIRGVSPMPRDSRMKRRYLQALQQHLYPPPVMLQVEPITSGPRMDLYLVDIPPQPEELKPFLVGGALVGSKIRGSFIGIVSRHGDITIPTTAAEIHATLAAGRALLRRGVLSADDPLVLRGDGRQ
jgi:hypothetical protein